MDSHTAAPPGLQVGVVGAGVAGLSAASALRRIGHNVEVNCPASASCSTPNLLALLTSLPQIFERSLFKNENGAAVSIPPNGGRILKHWGFDSVKAGGIENIQVGNAV